MFRLSVACDDAHAFINPFGLVEFDPSSSAGQYRKLAKTSHGNSCAKGRAKPARSERQRCLPAEDAFTTRPAKGNYRPFDAKLLQSLPASHPPYPGPIIGAGPNRQSRRILLTCPVPGESKRGPWPPPSRPACRAVSGWEFVIGDSLVVNHWFISHSVPGGFSDKNKPVAAPAAAPGVPRGRQPPHPHQDQRVSSRSDHCHHLLGSVWPEYVRGTLPRSLGLPGHRSRARARQDHPLPRQAGARTGRDSVHAWPQRPHRRQRGSQGAMARRPAGDRRRRRRKAHRSPEKPLRRVRRGCSVPSPT